jgi:membrane protease YdiL (CAAX protease family)
MSKWKWVVVYVVGVFVLAGFLAPVLYHFGHSFLDYPFSRYVNRALMVSALLLLFPLAWVLQIRKWSDVGLGWDHDSIPEYASGFLLGILSLGFVIWIFFKTGGLELRPDPKWQRAGSILLAVALVAPLEGLLFRGVIQKHFVQGLGYRWGVALVALIFAVVHFIKVPRGYVPAEIDWTAGFRALGLAFRPLGDLLGSAEQFAVLVLVGWILGLVVLRTGRLWGSIGLHAGWILALQASDALARSGKSWSTGWRWLGNDPGASVLTVLVLVLLALGLWRFYRPSQPKPADGA